MCGHLNDDLTSMYLLWSRATEAIFESRAVACDLKAGWAHRGDFPAFKKSTIARRGPEGQSFREPDLAFWAFLSQKWTEYRLNLARKSPCMVSSIGVLLQGLSDKVGQFLNVDSAHGVEWWKEQFGDFPTDVAAMNDLSEAISSCLRAAWSAARAWPTCSRSRRSVFR